MEKESADVIYGRNPVKEALLAGTPLEKLYFQHGCIDDTVISLRKMAQSRGIHYTFVDRRRLEAIAGRVSHQGVVAKVQERPYATIEEIVKISKRRNELAFILACFQIQDPHNLGSLIRTGEAVGLHGIVIPLKKSVGLTATVSKVASGADSHVPLARVSDLSSTMGDLRQRGIKIIGAHPGRGVSYIQADYRIPLVLVLGSEGKGLDTRLITQCDEIVHIPLAGKINSLNVGVAGALILYEVLRQRGTPRR